MHKAFALSLMLLAAAPLAAEERAPTGTFLVDVVIARPGGLIATLVGSALFAALSPLTAFAAIAPPHDAFAIGAEALVLTPARFTFARPVGVFTPDPSGRYN